MSTLQDVESQIVKEDLDDGFRKTIALITWIIILLIPVYSVTITSTSHFSTIREKSFLWPWMILTQYTPSSAYNADQYAVVAFPWSYILFIPFLYALKASWKIYITNKEKALNSAYIIIASIVQLFLIFMTYRSQTSAAEANESVSVYYAPQIILIVFHSIVGFRWYIEELGQARKNLKV